MLAIFALVVLFVPGTAKADSQTTFDVTGTLGTAGALTGSFTIDFGTSSDSLVSSTLNVGSDTFSCPGATGAFCTLYTGVADAINVGNSAGFIQLDWAPGSLTSGSTGFPLTYGYLKINGVSYLLNSGGFTTAVTPEPATWLLIITGAGLLGFLGLRRRAVA
ncbi:MAG: PEP-CTERM sorting domain-containing protein [Candidatus Acidiferrales bacterium]